METPAVIIDEAVQSTSTAVVGQMPTRAALRQRIRRRRGTIEAAPPQPLSRASIVLPERYTMYSADERFLLYDSGHGDEDRILVFGREAYGAWCGEMKVLFVDGTFSVAPSLFAQVSIVSYFISDVEINYIF
ncbi:hypothetical protein M513_14370, partial [Trichuris suis]